MATTAQVLSFLSSKGADGATFSDIQRFICEQNGRNYDDKDASGRRANRGYWADRLCGSGYDGRTGLLEKYCTKVDRKYVLKSLSTAQPKADSNLDQQVRDAQAEMATWSPEKRASVQLEGKDVSVLTPNAPIPDLDPKDLKIDTFRPASASAWISQPDSGVRVTHIPTGISAECSSDRSQHRNKANAMIELMDKVADHFASGGKVKTEMTIKVS